jgi:hypothetical protein
VRSNQIAIPGEGDHVALVTIAVGVPGDISHRLAGVVRQVKIDADHGRERLADFGEVLGEERHDEL